MKLSFALTAAILRVALAAPLFVNTTSVAPAQNTLAVEPMTADNNLAVESYSVDANNELAADPFHSDFISESDIDLDIISNEDLETLLKLFNATEPKPISPDSSSEGHKLVSRSAEHSVFEIYRNMPQSLFKQFRETSGTSDEVCNTYSSAFMPYTGFRFVTTSKLLLGTLLTKKTSHLVYCYQGKEITRASNKISYGKREILWGTKYCFTDADTNRGIIKGGPFVDGCYAPARIARAQQGETAFGVSWRRPERIYGGLFRVPRTSGKVVNDFAVPVSPLIADEPYMGFIENRQIEKNPLHKEIHINVPAAYTPDYYGEHYPMASDSWAKYIDIKEEYKPILPERLPLDSSSSVQWVTLIRWIFMNDIILAQFKNIYQEMPWRPDIIASAIMGTASTESLEAAGIADIKSRLGLDKVLEIIKGDDIVRALPVEDKDILNNDIVESMPYDLKEPTNDIVESIPVKAAGIPVLPGAPGSGGTFMPITKHPYKQPDWLIKLRKKIVKEGLTAGGAAYRNTMNQVKTRLVMIEDKQFAKFIYMTISYMINP